MGFFIFSDDYSLVIERSNGLWHTKCFERPTPPTSEKLVNICNKLGYTNATARSTDGRVIVLTARSSQNRYRQAPTKTKVVNPFSTLRINEKFEIKSFKPSRPLNILTKWNDLDTDNCFQLEINCMKNRRK